MQLTPNLKFDTRLKQETQNFFGFYDFKNCFVFFSKILEEENKEIQNF